MTSKNRFELLLDQIEHYISTYGTHFEEAPFIVNDEFWKLDLDLNFKEYKIIRSATKEEIISRTNSLLESWTEILMGYQDIKLWINWRWEDGADDFDLSYLNNNWETISWYNNFYNDENSIVFSGDMTIANTEATELIYIKKK